MATEKQKQAFIKSVENRGNISKAMREAGYSDKTAKNPKNLTESDGWKELLDEFIPDDLLQRKLKEGLDAGKTIYKNNVSSGEIEEVGIQADFLVRHKYLDTALKLRDKYPATKTDLTSNGKEIKVIIPQAVADSFNLNGTNQETGGSNTEQGSL